MVIVLDAKDAETPVGKPVAEPIPVTPVVEKVTDGSVVLMQTAGAEEAALTVLAGVTLMVPVAFAAPHVPVSGML